MSGNHETDEFIDDCSICGDTLEMCDKNGNPHTAFTPMTPSDGKTVTLTDAFVFNDKAGVGTESDDDDLGLTVLLVTQDKTESGLPGDQPEFEPVESPSTPELDLQQDNSDDALWLLISNS